MRNFSGKPGPTAVAPVITLIGLSLLMALAVGGRAIPLLRASGAESGLASTSIGVQDADASTRLVVVQDSVEGSTVSRFEIDLPIGRPTIIATYDRVTDDLEGLAISSGDGEDVIVTPDSTAAALVALSPGVLVTDGAWIGLVGHAVNGPAFDDLVAAVESADRLDDPSIREALTRVVAALDVTAVSDCAAACGEWLAASRGVLVQNADLSRAVLTSASLPTLACATADPAERIAESASFEVATDVLRGAQPEPVELGPITAAETLTRIVDLDQCNPPLDVTVAGLGEAGTLAWWATVVSDFADPFLRVITDSGSTLSPETVDELTQLGAARPGTPNVADAVGLAMTRHDPLSADQLRLIEAILPIIGNGLYSAVDVDAETARVRDADAPAPTPTPVPTPTPTPEPIPTPTPAPIPTPTPAPAAATVSATFLDQPASGQWAIDVTVTNTGTTPISLSADQWRLQEQGGGGVALPTSVSAGISNGTLAPGTSLTGTVTFNLTQSGTAYFLVWELSPGAAVAVDLT